MADCECVQGTEPSGFTHAMFKGIAINFRRAQFLLFHREPEHVQGHEPCKEIAGSPWFPNRSESLGHRMMEEHHRGFPGLSPGRS